MENARQLFEAKEEYFIRNGAMPRPIVYLNVKSSNIFWMSPGLPNYQILVFLVPIALEADFFQGNSIDGTIGYIYLEYLDTLHVTEKCDVYGFGVELVEVLTGHHPIEMFLGYINLVDCFVLSMEENCILRIVDDVVLSQGSNEDIQAFTELALRCIKKKGDERPAMREVMLEIRRIQHLVWSKQNNETSSAQTPLKSCN
uniref:Protein kinase domain-containing protein n=1 Tax=Quercus lobata TaxID=97700 RepID=A0A7N2M7R5_QUELO